MKITTSSPEETRQFAAELATSLLQPGDLVVLSGEMGAGKTAFTQGIGRGLGVTDRVVSPTFMIVREYDGLIPLVHMDVYRLDHIQELHDLGFEELVDSGRVTVVEWGERVSAVMPADRLEISIGWEAAWGSGLEAGDLGDELSVDGPEMRDDHEDERRDIEVMMCGERWASRAEALQSIISRWNAAGVGRC